MVVNKTVEGKFGDLRVIEQIDVPGVFIQATSRFTFSAQDEPETFHPTVAVFLDKAALVELIETLQEALEGVYETEAEN